MTANEDGVMDSFDETSALLDRRRGGRSTTADSSEEDAGEQAESLAPDGGYGWVVCAASFMALFIVDGVGMNFGILLPTLVQEFR